MESLYKFPSLVRDVFKENPELKYSPIYSKLSAGKMMFVMLVADFYSPIRNKWKETDEHELRELAIKRVGYWRSRLKVPTRDGEKLLKGEIVEVEKAIMEYRLEQGGEYLEKLHLVKNRIFGQIEKPISEESKNYGEQIDFDLRLVEKEVLLKLAKQEESLLEMARKKRERNKPVDDEELKVTDEQEEEDIDWVDPDT